MRETLIVGTGSSELFLPLQHPAALPLRSAAISMAGTSNLVGTYEVARTGPRYHVVLFSIRGRGTLETEKGEYHLPRGTVAVLPAGIAYRYRMVGRRWTIAWFHLSRRKQWRELELANERVRESALGERLHYLSVLFAEELAEGREREGRLAAELLSRTLLRALSAPRESQSTPEERLRVALRLVEENPSHPWTVDEIARLVHVSSQHLYRLTAQCWSSSPMAAVAQIRIERAALLLRHTDLSIAQVAEHVGYSDAFAFSTAFKRLMSRSPRTYRGEGGGPD